MTKRSLSCTKVANNLPDYKVMQLALPHTGKGKTPVITATRTLHGMREQPSVARQYLIWVDSNYSGILLPFRSQVRSCFYSGAWRRQCEPLVIDIAFAIQIQEPPGT